MSTHKRAFLAGDHIYRDLTVGLVLLFVASPVLTFVFGSHRISDYLLTGFLVFALFEISRRRSDLVIGLCLGVPAVVGSAINAQTPDTPAFNAGPTMLSTVFLGFLIWRILGDVLSGSRVTRERLWGAVCAYLLIGLLFTNLYAFVVVMDHGAFAVSEPLRARLAIDEATRGFDLLSYFSFVTMTTLGYGDITPVSLTARTVAWLQALVGQLYLTVMVAGLVGIHIARNQE